MARLFGRYEYRGELGRGASGRVFAALDHAELHAGEPARRALKVVPEDEAGRLVWEFARLCQVEHPRVARVRELTRLEQAAPAPFALARGALVLVEDFVEGERLSSAIAQTRDRTQRIELAARVGLGLCEALSALHDAGLLHGDLKPENVLCELDGSGATLIDLGFARPPALGAVPRGTPAYMAPELFAGVCTPAADVFALGALLHDCLRGEPRASGKSSSNVPWRTFDARAPGLGEEPALSGLLARLLAPDHHARPADARAALALLQPAFAAAGAQLELARLPLSERSPEERAARARTLPFHGHARALSQLVAQLDEAPLVLVRGARGSGRSRLIREAIRVLQEQRARADRPVPTWVGSFAGLAQLRDVDAILWLTGSTEQELPRVQREAALAKLAVRSLCVVLECEPGEQTRELPAVELGALDEAEFAELTRTLLAPERVDAQLLAAARASALGLSGRVCELASGLALAERDPIDPRSWSALALEQRAEPLSPAALDVARALAWWAAAFTPVHAARLLATPMQAERAYEELRVKGLLAQGDDPEQPEGEGALALVPSLARALRSERPATAFAGRIEASGVRARSGFAWVAEGELERAARAFVHEAERLRAQGRSDAACGLLAEAEHWLHDPALRWLRADSERAAGRYGRALELLADHDEPAARALRAELARMSEQGELARELLEGLSTGSGAQAARARAQRARLAFDAGDFEGARKLLESALDSSDREAQLRALEVDVLISLYTGELARAPVDALVANAVTTSGIGYLTRAPARAHALRAQVLLRRGERARALRDLRVAVAQSRALGELHEAATYALNLGLMELESGELGRALETLRDAAQRLGRVARTRDLSRVLFNMAALSLLIGDFERCQLVLSEARRALGSAPDHLVRAYVALVSAELSFSRGALDAAERELEQAIAELPTEARSARALIAARASQVAVARHALDRAEHKLALARQDHDALDHDGTLELLSAELALALARADTTSAERFAQRGLALPAESGSFAERLRFLLLAIESARAAGALRVLAERTAVARAMLERALVSLPSELRAKMRAVPAYARVFAQGEFAREEASERKSLDTPERWRSLVRASRRLFNEARGERVAQRLTEIALELVHAERALVLAFDARGELALTAHSELLPEGERALGFSRSVVERVALDGAPLMTVEAGRDVRLDRAESVAALQVRSVLCIELLGLSERAFLYLDDRLRPAAFAAEDVALLEDLVELARQALRSAEERSREVRRARRAEQRQRRLSRELARPEPVQGDSPLVGASPVLARVLASARKIARSDAPLLITGESGTGKELLARYVHVQSPRRERAFVAESCAALPDTLLESALFGHVRGAFTGAERAHKGLFEAADGGTLLLDEVGEMSPSLQGKLLRVLQEGELRPVGSERTRSVDVRVIGATRSDLAALVQSGRFREDLYYRLAVVTLELPSLRDRPEDIAPLVAHFLAKHAHGRAVQITPRALRALEQRSWPGNVRELENEVRRALAFSEHEIDLAHLSEVALDAPEVGELDLHGRTDNLTRSLVREALARADGNVTRAASLLGVSRFGLQKILKRLQLPAK